MACTRRRSKLRFGLLSGVFALLCLGSLAACEGYPNRLQRLVPDFFPIKDVVYWETGLRGCSVAIFALEDSFSARLDLGDADKLNRAARHRRFGKVRDKPHYPVWRKTPIAPYTKIESEPLYNVMECLYEPKPHRDLFEGLMDTRVDGYFTTQNGFDLVIYVPARNVVVVSSYR